jgi:preprotein translocase subunit SecG
MSPTGQGASSEAEAREKARARAEAIAYREQNRKDRAKARTLTNMVWALLACFVVVAFLMIVTWRPKHEQVKAVEYTAQLEDAKKVAPWVRGPEPMPSGWTATSVEFRTPEQAPITWHLGVVTNEKKYVGLEQSNVTGAKFQSDELGRTSDDGTSAVGGVTWQRKVLLDRKEENALVLVGSGTTTIVTGNAGYPALEAFASALR